MASWDLTPDPYTYRRAQRLGLGGRPVYIVSLGDRVLGVIVRGRGGFRAVVPARHSFTGDLLGLMGGYIERDRRRDAADDLVEVAERDEAMTPEFIARSIAFYDREDPVK